MALTTTTAIRDYRATILTALQYGLSNARIEAVNTESAR